MTMPDVYTRFLALVADVIGASDLGDEDAARDGLRDLWRGLVPVERAGAARLAAAVFRRHLHHYDLSWIDRESREGT